MRTSKCVALAFGTLFAAGAALAGPNSDGKPNQDASVGANPFSNIVVVDCAGVVQGSLDITATGTNDDGGGNDTVYLNVWDDGSIRSSQSFQIPVGVTTTTTVSFSYPGPVGSGAPGIGLYFGETASNGGGADTLFSVDPFFPSPCSAAAPMMSEWAMVTVTVLLGWIGATSIWRRRRG